MYILLTFIVYCLKVAVAPKLTKCKQRLNANRCTIKIQSYDYDNKHNARMSSRSFRSYLLVASILCQVQQLAPSRYDRLRTVERTLWCLSRSSCLIRTVPDRRWPGTMSATFCKFLECQVAGLKEITFIITFKTLFYFIK